MLNIAKFVYLDSQWLVVDWNNYSDGVTSAPCKNSRIPARTLECRTKNAVHTNFILSW